MNTNACSLNADELAAQLERYRAIGRLATAVEHEARRVVVTFADDPPGALIERTLEVERSCCPFFEIDYDPVTRCLTIRIDEPDRGPSLEAIAHALTEPRAAGSLPDGTPGGLRTVPGVTSCCNPTSLETCCEPLDKPECCGEPVGGRATVGAPSRCGCKG